MGRSQESFQKKELRNKKEKKRKEKEAKRLARKDSDKPNSLDDMIAYVDENGMITDTPPDPDRRTEINVEDIVIGVPKDDPNRKEDPIRKGTVTFFNDGKGFGFIRDAMTRESLFVHVNSLMEPIKEGNAVLYEMERGPKGMVAVNVAVDRGSKNPPRATE